MKHLGLDGLSYLVVAMALIGIVASAGVAYGVDPGGAQALTIAASNAPEVIKNRADYVCDGTDDQVQLQAASDAMTAGKIILSQGTFNISDTWTVHGGLMIEGAGMDSNATVLRGISGLNKDIIYWNATTGQEYFLSVRDLKIAYTATLGTVGHGIHTEGASSDMQFDHIFIADTPQDGFHIAPVWGCKITHCLAESCRRYGLYLSDSSQVSIDGMFIAYNNVSTDGAAGACISSDDVNIVNSEFYENERGGLYISGKRCGISNCTFIDNSQSFPGLDDGLFLSNDASSSQTRITGCIFTTEGTPTQRNGIYIESKAVQTTIVGNVIRGNRQNGIHIYAPDAVISGNVISSNGSIANTYSGILGEATASRLVITGNQFDGNSLTGVPGQQKYGVTLAGSNCSVQSNNFYNNGTPAVADNGSGNVFRNNVGWITENSGLVTIAMGNTSVVVTHGLAKTPAPGDVQVTPATTLGLASKYWVDNYTPTEFTINVDTDPNQAVNFVWQAHEK